MKERLLEEIQKGSKGAVMKKHIITYLYIMRIQPLPI